MRNKSVKNCKVFLAVVFSAIFLTMPAFAYCYSACHDGDDVPANTIIIPASDFPAEIPEGNIIADAAALKAFLGYSTIHP